MFFFVVFCLVCFFFINVGLVVVVMLVVGVFGYLMVGMFLGFGLLLGLFNVLLVWCLVELIIVKEYLLKWLMVFNLVL